MKDKGFAHRARLTAVPPDGFIKVLKDSGKDAGAVGEFMPINLLGAAPLSGFIAPVIPLFNGIRSITDGGVIPIDAFMVFWTTTGAASATLPDGMHTGHHIHIQMVADGGDGDLSITNGGPWTTAIFSEVGHVLEAVWDGSRWWPTALYNIAVGGADGPLLGYI